MKTEMNPPLGPPDLVSPSLVRRLRQRRALVLNGRI